jgi:hypothetical protein
MWTQKDIIFPGAGKIVTSATETKPTGGYLKTTHYIPSTDWIARRLKYLFIRDHQVAMREIELAEGITFDRKADQTFFSDNEIHIGIFPDDNHQGVFFFLQETAIQTSGNTRLEIPASVFAKVAPSDPETNYSQSACLVRAITSILNSIRQDNTFLIGDYPLHVPENIKPFLQPTSVISFGWKGSPDGALGKLNDYMQSIPRVDFTISIEAKTNTFKSITEGV